MSKLAAAVLTCAALLSASFCGTATAQAASTGVVPVVAAENFYGDVVRQLGGTIVQPAQTVPGTSFGVLADAQGHRVGVASAG